MTKPDLTNTAPKRIYLDIGDQFALERVTSGDLRWDLLDGVTWSEDNATSHGIPYVRADLVPTPAASGAAPADIRARFEHWYSDEGRSPTAIKRNNAGFYVLMGAHSAWRAWEACAAALASREASTAPLTDEQIDKLLVSLDQEFGMPLFGQGDNSVKMRVLVRDALASPQLAPEGRNVTAKEHATLMGAARASSVLVSSGRAAPVQVAPQDDARDAARYRAWRDASLTTSSHFLDAIVEYMESRTDAGKLPTADEVDAAMDAAMTSAPAAKPAEPTLPTQGEQA